MNSGAPRRVPHAWTPVRPAGEPAAGWPAGNDL